MTPEEVEELQGWREFIEYFGVSEMTELQWDRYTELYKKSQESHVRS